jgi:hypothetical protein
VNAKKAKKLRQMARKATAGMPERKLVIAQQRETGNVRVVRQRAENSLKSTRGTYRWLKKQRVKAMR